MDISASLKETGLYLRFLKLTSSLLKFMTAKDRRLSKYGPEGLAAEKPYV